MSGRSCDDVRGLLAWFAGGDLDVADRAAVREHLVGCVGCRNEAAALQRAVAGLQQAARSAVPAVDEAFFASLQRDIGGRIEALDAAGASRPALPWRGLAWAAAAAALMAVGFVWAAGRVDDSVWTRPAVATPAAFGEPKAVPWSGPRASMRLLGNDDGVGDAGDATAGEAQGLRARDSLRDLVDDSMWRLPRPRTPR